MKNIVIDRSIEINALPVRVWRVFTDPVLTKQMGGEYLSDWKTGSSFSFKGLDGTIYTSGEILQIENEKLLKHSLFSQDEKKGIISVITYTLIPNGEGTLLCAKEELTHSTTDEKYEEMLQGWDAALNAVRSIAES